MYDHVKSMNSVTATVHEDTVKNVLLTDVRYYLLIMSVNKPFFTVVLEESLCPCPRRPVHKSLSLSFKSLSSHHKSLNPTLGLTAVDLNNVSRSHHNEALPANQTESTAVLVQQYGEMIVGLHILSKSMKLGTLLALRSLIKISCVQKAGNCLLMLMSDMTTFFFKLATQTTFELLYVRYYSFYTIQMYIVLSTH